VFVSCLLLLSVTIVGQTNSNFFSGDVQTNKTDKDIEGVCKQHTLTVGVQTSLSCNCRIGCTGVGGEGASGNDSSTRDGIPWRDLSQQPKKALIKEVVAE
jgi:hypothetical protein